MRPFAACLWTETLKVVRSRIFLITLLSAVFVPLMVGLMMLIVKHPELASRARMIAIKATMLGKANWNTQFENLAMIGSAVGLLLYGFPASWIFGREYSDRTVKDLLALPVPRTRIVLAKFVVVVGWNLVLAVVMFAAGLGIGAAVGLDGWSSELAAIRGLRTYAACGSLTLLLSTPVAFVACVGRGYLPPMGFILLTLMGVQISNFAGYSQFVPWAIPALMTGAAGPGGVAIGPFNVFIVVATSVAGYFATAAWWRFSDQT